MMPILSFSDRAENANGQGYFLVDPTLSVGTNDDDITLDCIQCQTVLAKSLGPLDEWEGRLRVAMETGYNMVHFTPIQDLGKSNSSYSIKDQLKLNPIFSKPGQNYGFKDVENLVAKLNREWKTLSMTDLVFNHTANNSDWLFEHPECGYNLHNAPHLKPAYLLDRILAHFSMEVGEGKYKKDKIFPVVDSHVQIQVSHIMRFIREILCKIWFKYLYTGFKILCKMVVENDIFGSLKIKHLFQYFYDTVILYLNYKIHFSLSAD